MRKVILVAIVSLCFAAAAYATCPYIEMDTESLPAFYVGVPAYFDLGAFGGTAPYTFQITSGSLPPGLSMNSAGEISGTPTTAGYDWTIFVKVTDANGCHLTQAFMVGVEP
ncbi:MAG TPA: Ig domain-containing protein [Thermoanaerobaculia bacterium]|nr:Ig domain-containing protein [Thermoanaerobaculia bacterium]